MDPKVTTVSATHLYCPASGFCMKCGAHHEVVKYERLMCIYSENTVAISHRRASQIYASLAKQGERNFEPAS